jgi:hypothetical protein
MIHDLRIGDSVHLNTVPDQPGAYETWHPVTHLDADTLTVKLADGRDLRTLRLFVFARKREGVPDMTPIQPITLPPTLQKKMCPKKPLPKKTQTEPTDSLPLFAKGNS